MKAPWPIVPLGQAIRHRKEFITIDDLTEYKRCRVQLHAKGIVLRDIVIGAAIRTKKQQVCTAGEFLVAEIDAKVGGFGIVPDDLDGAIVSSHYFLYEINEQQLERRFLDYYVRTRSFRDQVEAQGSTNYAAIRPQHVLDYTIPLPPLAEQQRIVARIDALAARIEEAKGLRAQAVAEVAAVMGAIRSRMYDVAAAISQSMYRLDDLCVQITDGTHRTPTYVDSGIPFLSVKDITTGEIRFDDCRYVTVEEHAELTKRCKPERGDVLLTKVGTTGYAKVVDVDREFSIFVSLALLKIDRRRLSGKYVEHMLNSSRLQEYSKEGTRGVGNQNLVLRFIREFPMPLPTLQQQESIAAHLDGQKSQVDAVKRLQAETQAELNALLPAVLDRAFRGEL